MGVIVSGARFRREPTYKQTEVGLIPHDWVCLSINQIAANCANAIVGGPFGSDLVSRDYVDFGVPVVRGQNMGKRYVSGEFVFVSKSKAKQLQANTARVDDIVFTQRGTLGQVSMVPREPFEEYVVSQSQMKLTLNRKLVSPKYVYHYFRSKNGQQQILDSAIQTGVPHTNLGILRSYKIPAPPSVCEQEAIAEALSNADEFVELLEKLLTKKRRIKQGAMQELLTGKKRLPKFKDSWAATRLGQLANIQRGASPRPIDDPIWFDEKSTVGWVRISDVTKSSMYLDETTQRLSSLGIQSSRPVAAGSLIMSICATVGRPIITNIDVCIHDGFVVFDNLRADQKFIYYVLKSIEDNWTRHGQTGSQMNLNTGLINRTEVTLPRTIDEQAAIASILSDMDAEITALEAKLDKACQIKQGMMQELLTGRIRLV